MRKQLHVVSFQVPWPPTYGGVIDVWYKLKALSEAGIDVTLHTFAYNGRDISAIPSLRGLTVRQYIRPTDIRRQISLLPYIVSSRTSSALVEALLADNAPILFEGLHTCAPLMDSRFSNRNTIVRMHNVEHDYYRALSSSEDNLLKKTFFRIEAYRLKRFEKILTNAKSIAAITHKDLSYFADKYPQSDSFLLPCFFDNTIPDYSDLKLKPYVLYHGNLSVVENVRAAIWIIDHVASALPDIKFIIAGDAPSEMLTNKADDSSNVQLIASPSATQMDQLVHEAAIHLLITFQDTGIKLKLLNSLKSPGTVIANSMMVSGTDLRQYIHIADNPRKIAALIAKHINTKIGKKCDLPPAYNNQLNIERLITRL